MSMAGPGAIRGAVAAAALVLAVVTLPILLTSDPTFAPVTLPFVALASLLGAICGTIAGRLLDSGRTWRTAAAVSGATAMVAVVAVTVLISDGRLFTDLTGFLVLAALLAGGAVVVAVWQSWAMARRQDRRPVRPRTQT
ncbi:hypothetical protein WDZ16_01350 [Pseudokineococcus marinus]|uniref:Uncharacterized protein n=1 Tax=Pseudokineococcus marinus TaxID=351215 RepID=A0A849BVC1_9ACTN|nr:hypothetical protein [Pseudokineococcus marinus]NNH21508.1 hypothetical protein [Pseudokineococcus marinus]